jgi:hypothetical protein
MLNGRVFGLLCHGLVLLERFGEIRAHRARSRVEVRPPGEWADQVGSKAVHMTVDQALESCRGWRGRAGLNAFP